MPKLEDPFAGIVDGVIVISLPDHQRRMAIDDHFGEMGIAFEYFDAFDGAQMDLGALKQSGMLAPKDKTWGKSVMSGEVGCYFSHLAALVHALGQGWSRVLICEDDAEFLYVPRFLRTAMEFAPDDADMLYLFSSCAPGCGHEHDLERKYSNEYWREASHEGYGATAYIANVRTIGYLLENAFPMRFALDGLTKWPSSAWCDVDLNCYICDPMLCGVREVPSTIRGLN